MTAPGAPNAQFNLSAPDSLAARVAVRARRRMYARFLAATAVQPDETVLDVGATSDRTSSANPEQIRTHRPNRRTPPRH